MKNFSEQRRRQDYQQAFKETTVRFNQPLPGIVNQLDAFEGLLRGLQPDLPLIDFSPFTRVEARVDERSAPLLEAVPTDRQPVSGGAGNRDSSSPLGGASAPKLAPEATRTARDNGTPDSLMQVAPVPVFEVSPGAGHQRRAPSDPEHRGLIGTREYTRPSTPAIRERATGGKPVYPDSPARPFSAANDLRQTDSRNEPHLSNRQDRPSGAGGSSLASALEIVGRLADELFTNPPESVIDTSGPTNKGRAARHRTADAQTTPSAEKKPIPAALAAAPPALVRHGIGYASTGPGGEAPSDSLAAHDAAPASNSAAAALTINRIDALTDRLLLVDQRYRQQHGRPALQRPSLSTGVAADPSPAKRTAVRIAAEKQILPKPPSASTADAVPQGSGDELRQFDQSRRNPAAVLEPALTAEQLAELINDVLVDQARRHGVDLL
jgi:hypothetical protein